MKFITRDLQEAIHAWTSAWFDGSPHVVAGREVALPAAEIVFDQARARQPIDGGVQIAWVMSSDGAGGARLYQEGAGRRDFQSVPFLIFVRAAGWLDSLGRSAPARARLVADELYNLLSQPADVAPLIAAGMGRISVVQPRQIADGHYAVWVLRLGVELQRVLPAPGMPIVTAEPPNHPVGQTELSRLWYEWLAGYFDGASHSVQGEVTAFPRAVVTVGVHEAPRPREEAGVPELEIEIRSEPKGAPRTWLDGGGRRMHAAHSLHCLVHARAASPQESVFAARRAADLLYALFTDTGARLGLSRAGLTRFTVDNPKPLSGTDERIRGLTVHYETQTRIAS